jgi:transposase-like protein
MSNMSKKNGAAPPREGTASAVREAARSGDPERATSPDRPKRRAFAAEYKLRILQETDEVLASGEAGGIGEVLRREGLYSSHLTKWRQERDEGQHAGLMPKKRGRKPQPQNPLADEYTRLQREHDKLKRELFKANAVIEVQRKVAALLGEVLPAPTEEDFVQAPARFRPGRLDVRTR